jgi:predicted nucleic acid-binding protein
MFTIDASVWVNGFDEREPNHASSRQLLHVLAVQGVPVVVPHLLLVEVAGAISRTRQNATQAQSFATALSHLPNVTYVALDERLARLALTLAAQHGCVAPMRFMRLWRWSQGAHWSHWTTNI